jgi:hypothetical protein
MSYIARFHARTHTHTHTQSQTPVFLFLWVPPKNGMKSGNLVLIGIMGMWPGQNKKVHEIKENIKSRNIKLKKKMCVCVCVYM